MGEGELPKIRGERDQRQKQADESQGCKGRKRGRGKRKHGKDDTNRRGGELKEDTLKSQPQNLGVLQNYGAPQLQDSQTQ